MMITHLTQADREQGLSLLSAAGIKGSPEQLKQVVERYQANTTALTLLATYLKRWYAGRLNGLDTLPPLPRSTGTDPAVQAVRQVLAAFENKMQGSSDLTLLTLLSLSDQPVPQQPMKAVFRSTLMERWLTKRDEYVRFLGPLGRLSEEHWHWVIENLRRLKLLEQPGKGHHDLLELPQAVRDYFRTRLRTNSPEVFRQATADMEKLFRETVVDFYYPGNHPAITTRLDPMWEAKRREAREKRRRTLAILWQPTELDDAHQQVLALRKSLQALNEHSHRLQASIRQLQRET
ncbi:MAG: hypothetical protein KDI15_11670 [Thiothrix sp.]|nr:hypothetical protein [Thiothrix sp.]HPE59406.1 hypothetical protein [Thiolinea sp.]